MIQFIYVITQFVDIFISLLLFLMMIRAILSLLLVDENCPVDEDSHIYNFVMMVTEPVIIPVRMILDRFDGINDLPIDVSFLIAFVLLSVVQIMLPGVV